MIRFIDPAWAKVIRSNGLDRFDVLWELPFEALDVANHRAAADSFSQVGLLELKGPDGSNRRLVIKKQQNYLTRSLRHPIYGIPTFERELKNILAYRQHQIPVLSPVLLAVATPRNPSRAVLLTEFLDGYLPLEQILENRASSGTPDRETMGEILQQTARIVRRIHDCGFQYGCLYPKHVFVSLRPEAIAVRLIDLENSRRRPFGRGRVSKDLETLFRHGGWRAGRGDRLRFLLAYTGEKRPGPESRSICSRVRARYDKKRGRHQEPTSSHCDRRTA